MRAVAYKKSLPIEHPESLLDLERAHALIENGGARGKVVLAGFGD